MKSIFHNIIYLRRKERKSTLLLLCVLIFSSFVDDFCFSVKRIFHNQINSEIAPQLDEENKNQIIEKKILNLEEVDSIIIAEVSLPSDINDTLKQHQFEQGLTELTQVQQSEKEILSSVVAIQPISPFDPNTVDHEGLTTYGFSDFFIRNCIKYRNAGGTFKIKSDLLKIYGVDTSHFESISHLIELPDQYIQEKPTSKKNYRSLEINSATAEDFKHIPGIGPVLSERIVKFREKLGGFYSLHQLKEVYGVQDSVISNYITHLSLSDKVNRININSASELTLSQHPYINLKTAQIIVNFRKQNGNFFSKEDLLEIAVIDEVWVKKVAPYLEY